MYGLWALIKRASTTVAEKNIQLLALNLTSRKAPVTLSAVPMFFIGAKSKRCHGPKWNL